MRAEQIILEASSTMITHVTEDTKQMARERIEAGYAMQNNFIILPDDVEQIALIEAEATPYNYPFKLLFNDAPPAKHRPSRSQSRPLALSLGMLMA